ncbi:MAG TPA: hypothetical protein VKO87_13050 [Gemmatimonadaceae bacterium]|nr:hypothetical protein [Gemmatimonadaceae bacterium]
MRSDEVRSDCDPLLERDPLLELPDPLIPLDPLVLPGDRDEFWSFLFRSFAIISSRPKGVLMKQHHLRGAMPPL